MIKENNLSFCDKRNTEQLMNNIDSIVNNLKNILSVKLSKEKLNDNVDTVIINLRVFYDSINEYMTEEYNIWEAENCKQE